MNKKRGIAGLVAAGVVVAGLTLGAAAPAFAGEWAWGAKNCAPSNFPTTHSGGSGTVTHAISLNGAIESNVYYNGSTIANRIMYGTEHWASGASVAGPSTTYGGFTC